MHKKSTFRLILSNPFLWFVPLMIAILVGWQWYVRYEQVIRDFNVATPTSNLLPGGEFDQLDANGAPSGWQLATSSADSYTTAIVPGKINKQAFKLHVAQYQRGDITLQSARMDVETGKTYL